jgi:hypothetical protein
MSLSCNYTFFMNNVGKLYCDPVRYDTKVLYVVRNI